MRQIVKNIFSAVKDYYFQHSVSFFHLPTQKTYAACKLLTIICFCTAGLFSKAQVAVQAVGVVAAAAWCGGWTWVILKLVALMARLRVSEDKETEGLDLAEHGERGYSQ